MTLIRSLFFLLVLVLIGCKASTDKTGMFVLRKGETTGINFSNILKETKEFNVFKYLYFYNGSGLGAADLNNDGLVDLFFASNEGANKIFLNQGGLKFRDISNETGIPDDGAWSTGVSITDINNDGLADIYVCRVSNYVHLKGHNLLLLCSGIDANGIPHYKDVSTEYGLDFEGFSTQAVFFDYDLDGDLDMYLLNHSIHENGAFGPRAERLKDTVAASGDRLYKNEDGHFRDVTDLAGIHRSVLGFGLGVSVSDINMDGYPDLYIGNDFHENDYLYINQKNGTFKEEIDEHTMHTSKYTMGVDIGDADNDGLPEIFSMDMLPADPYILKRSEGDDRWDILNARINYGYNIQYTRNNLQYNRGNGMFSELGLYSGISATDWSWSALLMDFDNDGRKDLFISNGIPKRLNDIDYVDYASNKEVQTKIRENQLDEQDLALTNKFPQIKIPNKFFLNNGNMKFQDLDGAISNDQPSFSNGAVYADLDNDGDLDIVVNNLEEDAFVYENTSRPAATNDFIQLQLKGSKNNITATGSKVFVYTQDSIHTYEYQPVHGFMSSMYIPLHIGIKNLKIDSINIVWPDNTYQSIQVPKDTAGLFSVNYREGLESFSYASLSRFNKSTGFAFEDITMQTGIEYKHEENYFNEFGFEPLLPHMTSTDGPALCVDDINNDGLDDVFIGASKGGRPAVFVQQRNGKFTKTPQRFLDADSSFESVDAKFVDVNNDGFKDLIIASGGNEFIDVDQLRQPRLYMNDGKGLFVKKPEAFANIYVSASTIEYADINKDGYTDIFIGAKREPWQYGVAPASFLLLNDRSGNFKNITKEFAPDLSNIGMVNDAVWADIDKDGDSDLLLAIEWGNMTAFVNDSKGHLSKRVLNSEKKGWWNFVYPIDIDNDGDLDLVAGNLGLNSRLTASDKEPVNLYLNDFDDNGNPEELLTYYLNHKEIPFADKLELQTQLPLLKKNYLYAGDFARASLKDVFGESGLSNSVKRSVNYFENAVFINEGDFHFTAQALPWKAQLSTYRDAINVDINKDGLQDIILVGNFYESNTQMGRYDADFGTVLLNKGNKQFQVLTMDGLTLKGQSRHIRKINIAGKESFIIARNNDNVMVIRSR